MLRSVALFVVKESPHGEGVPVCVGGGCGEPAPFLQADPARSGDGVVVVPGGGVRLPALLHQLVAALANPAVPFRTVRPAIQTIYKDVKLLSFTEQHSRLQRTVIYIRWWFLKMDFLVIRNLMGWQ